MRRKTLVLATVSFLASCGAESDAAATSPPIAVPAELGAGITLEVFVRGLSAPVAIGLDRLAN